MESNEDIHFLAYPEVEAVLNDLYPSLEQESDRGAVLLAVSTIDKQLTTLFEASIPPGTSKKRWKDVFNKTGPFGSLSSKLDIAYTCRMLQAPVVESIHIMRDIRNEAAHGTVEFTLEGVKDKIEAAYQRLGDSIPSGVNRLAVETVGTRVMKKLSELRDPLNNDNPMFSSYDEAVKALLSHESAIDTMNKQIPKVKLIFATHLICGIIFKGQREHLTLHSKTGI